MKHIIISILLILVAIILMMILLPFAIIWQSRCIFKEHKPYSYMSKLLFGIAQCIDELGNVAYQELWNDWLITKDSKHLFGKPEERISSVIGKNLLNGTLSKTGLWLNKQLDKIEKNHSVLSIQNNV